MMKREHEIVVDGKVRGILILEMTPMGISVTVTGDVEIRPVKEKKKKIKNVSLEHVLREHFKNE